MWQCSLFVIQWRAGRRPALACPSSFRTPATDEDTCPVVCCSKALAPGRSAGPGWDSTFPSGAPLQIAIGSRQQMPKKSRRGWTPQRVCPTTSAYSSTSHPAEPGCSPPSRPTASFVRYEARFRSSASFTATAIILYRNEKSKEDLAFLFPDGYKISKMLESFYTKRRLHGRQTVANASFRHHFKST